MTDLNSAIINSVLESKQRILNIDGVMNFRDIGGYQTLDGGKVSYGKIYRSAQLNDLSPGGIKQVEALKIRSVMDLRYDEEITLFPTPKSAFPKAHIISWQHIQNIVEANNSPESKDSPELNDSSSADKKSRLGKGSWRESLDSHDPVQVREAMRSNYPQKLYSHRAIYKDMLLRLINNDSPLLFHCAAGKDRTGVAAALVLSLLGVSDEDIISDYMITADTTKGLLDTFHAAGANTNSDNPQNFQHKLAQYPKHVIQPLFDTDPAYIKTLLNYVQSEYSGFDGYARSVLGLNTQQLTSLKHCLVD